MEPGGSLHRQCLRSEQTKDDILQVSSLPILIAAIFGFLVFLMQKLYRLDQLSTSERNGIFALLVTLLGWGGVSAYLSSTGVYTSTQFLELAPGYWLPYIPVVTAVILVILIAPLRDGIRKLVDGTAVHWLTGIHVLRILALGALIKASMGIFPETFAWFVGIPDLLFGLSAVPITWLACRGKLNDDLLMYWHLGGALVVIVPVFGLMHIFMREALFSELFVFPMVLAPTLVVPMLVMLNLMVVWRLLERRNANSLS